MILKKQKEILKNKKKLLVSSVDLDALPDIIKKLKKKFVLKFSKNSRVKTIKLIANADYYLASAGIQVDSYFLNRCNKLKEIISPSTGTDHLDLKEIKKRKIKITTIKNEFKLLNSFTATSELAFGLMLNIQRKIIKASQSASDGYWAREMYAGTQLYGKTLGILGLGRLGSISAKIGKGFGMKVLATDIKNKKISGVKMVNIKNLFRRSDIITIHIHLNDKTKNLVNKNFLKLMKPHSILINTSRGAIINEKDLLESLRLKKIAGAGLDIVVGEWLDQKKLKNHKLISYSRKNSNLLIVPHIGGSTYESISGARRFVCNKILKSL